MSDFELIGSIVRLKKFAPVVDLQWAELPGGESSLSLIDNYIVTGELAGHFEKIFESVTLKRHEKKALREGGILDELTHPRAHILRGQYGTGKSYFLLMLSALLESAGNNELFEELYGKFHMFDGIRYHMDHLRQSGSRYLVVRIDGVKNIDMRFHELVQKSVIARMEKVLGEHDFYDSYGIAVRKLEEYKQDPIFSRLLHSVLESRALSYDALLDGLKASNRKSLKEYREIMEAITRHRIDEGFDSLEAFLRSASSYIKNKGYTGIVILFDEFSAYINASIEDRRITADLAAVQSLAQLSVPREGQDLFFICSMHVDIGRILGNVMAAAEEIQKVRGRFSEMTLSFSNSGNLVENIMVVDREGFSRLQGKYHKYFGALPSRYPDMAKVYPIHPHTIHSIIKVSSRFAQNERTIFSFFAEAVNKKLGEPVIKGERLNLITTREIYDYFIDTISERSTALKDSALRCMAFCKSELEKDVIKALVIAHVSAGEDADSRLSSKDIAFIIGIDDIKQVDIFLKEMSMNPVSNIVFYQKEYRFEFIAAGNTAGDISNKLDEDAAGVNAYDALLDALEDCSSAVCIRKSYTVNPSRDILPVRKDLAGVIYRPADLLKTIEYEMSSIEKDGKLLFVIPGFHDEIDRDFVQTVRTKLFKAPANICVAVPKSFPLQVEKDLKYYAAAKNMRHTGELDENARKTLQKIQQSFQKVIEHEIKKFGNTANFTFIFNDDTVMDSFLSLEELQKYLLLRHFSKFPRVDAEAIRGKNSIHMLVDNFLVFGEKTNIPANYSSEMDRLIMDVLRPLDMVKVERSGSGYSARLKIPEETNNPESYEIWTIVNDTGRTVKEVFTLLEEAPYGLPDYMVELYIAAAVAANRLVIKYKGQTVQLNKLSIALVNSAGYSLEEMRTASPELKTAVKRVWMEFCKIHGRCGARQFEPNMTQNDNDVHYAISGDMADIKAMLDGFEARLENAGIKNNTTLNLMKTVSDLAAVKNSIDYMEAFTGMPQKVSGINDYEAAFKLFGLFFDFVAQVNPHLDEIRRMDTALSEMRGLESIQEGYDELKTLYFDALGGFERLRRCIEENTFIPDEMKELKGKLSRLTLKYNEAFIRAHESLSTGIRELYAMFDSPAVKLIESFESISLKNIKRISEMRSDLHGMKACGARHGERDDEPLNCLCAGYQAGLAGLQEQLYLVQRMRGSIERQILNIGSNYVSRLAGLDENRDGNTMTFGVYLRNGGVDDTGRAVQEWEELGNYLRMGYDTVAGQYCEEVMQLVIALAPFINRYMTDTGPDRKQSQTNPAAKRKIGFRTLYTQIQSEIINSGYKSVTVEEFSRALHNIIERVRMQFDEVDIDE